jgi:hypothetical protein
MTERQLLSEVTNVVSRGCGCDHSCDDEAGQCGCEDDAKEIIALVLRFANQPAPAE